MISYRMNGLLLYIEIRANCYMITELEEKVIIQYILDIDSKGFPFKFKNVKDIVNHIFESKDAKYIEKL